jgi:hypothetical protein
VREVLALRKGICPHVGDDVRVNVADIRAGFAFLPVYGWTLPLRAATATRYDTPKIAQHARK